MAESRMYLVESLLYYLLVSYSSSDLFSAVQRQVFGIWLLLALLLVSVAEA